MKKIKYIIAIFIFSIIIMLIDVNNGYIKGHDTDFHMPNITATKEQISWDNLTAQEPLKYVANDFGYGTRFFYPPLPHLTSAYITKILEVFNIGNVAVGMRITQWLTLLLSGITFYLLCTKIFKNKKIATLLSLFYMTAPYHLAQIFIRDAFSEMFIPIAIPLIILGLLYLVDKNAKSETDYENMTFKQTFLIGLSQALAFIPGVSRSGITMTTGRAMGVKRESTAKYSFMLSAPIVLAATVFKLGDFIDYFAVASTTGIIAFVLGVLVSFIVGIIVIKFLLNYLKKGSFKIFAVYRVVVGLLVIAWLILK